MTPATGPGSAPAPPAGTLTGGRLLLRVARRTAPRVAALGVLLAGNLALALVTPALLAAAVDAVLDGAGSGPALLWGGAVVASGVCDAAMGPVAAKADGAGTLSLRLGTVRHLLRLGARSRVPAGEAVTQVTQAAPMAGGLPTALVVWGVSLAGSVAAFVALWWLDWRIGVAFTLGVPLSVLISRRFVGRATQAQSDYLAAQAQIATRLLGALGGARTIRASGTLDTETHRVLEPLAEVSAAGRAMWRLQKGTVWQFGLLLSLTEALSLAVAGLGVAAGRLSAGDLLAVGGYVRLALMALQQIDALFSLAQARSGAARIAGTLAHPGPTEGTRACPEGSGAVRLRGVTVRAAEASVDGGTEGPVLDGLDLDVPAGASMALVGRTGSGKSLLAGLIGRLTDPDRGEIELDGVPVRDMALSELRSAVTYAFEKPSLIGGTIHEAIGYGLAGPTRPDLVRAAQAARADGFVRRLPEGYDTPLEQAPMSGGERQRLGLARTLARSARVYVLDDATSGLDTVTEAEVSTAVTGVLAGRTRLVVAHRVATAARCDLVAWLDAGRIRAVGPHAQLWRDDAYRAVFAVDRADGDVAGGESGQTGDAGTGREADVPAPGRETSCPSHLAGRS